MATEMIFPSPTKLAHTRNINGDFGMFVNPYACDCQTCVDFVAEQPPRTPASLTSVAAAAAPPRPQLAHARNVNGDLGMFVNPHACNCQTCEDYLAEQRPAAPTSTPITLTTVPPSLPRPPSVDEVRAAEILMGLNRGAAALGPTVSVSSDDGIGPTPSIASDPLPAFPYSHPAGGLGLFSASQGAVRFWAPPRPAPSPHFTEEQIASLKSVLRDYAAVLVEQQNELDHTGCRSHDEMAAQDAEWDDLDRKIMEVDEILAVLGVTREED